MAPGGVTYCTLLHGWRKKDLEGKTFLSYHACPLISYCYFEKICNEYK